MNKLITSTIFVLGLCQSMYGQQMTQILPIYTDYSLWNPAAISPSGLYNGGINFSTDGISSETQSSMWNAFFHYPIKFQKMAFGANLTRNNFSGLKQTRLGFGFKYNLKFAEETALSLGIGSGLFLTGIDNERFIAADPTDALIISDGSTSFNYNLSGGLLFRHTIVSGFASEESRQRIIASFSTQQILGSTESILDNGFEIKRSQHYYTLLAYAHPFFQTVGTTFYYTNSYAVGYKMNHSLSVNFNFYNIVDWDLGYNTAGKIFLANGYSFRNIREDDRLRIKAMLSYDTRSIVQGNQIGMTISMLYTYDYDYTSFEM